MTEYRWDGAKAEAALGDTPTRAQLNALYAIPRDTRSDSKLPHHAVGAGGKVGAADMDGCDAAIAALNGARGGVTASAAEMNKAYSHLASHIRQGGGEPPGKQFGDGRPVELRAQRRAGMLRVPERLSLRFGAAGIEMRAKASGTGGTAFHFTGYAAVFDHPFEMWDFWGDEFTEVVNQGAFTRTLANGCDVPFLVGHNDAGFPLARTRSGTMTLGQDTHGLWVDAPGLDGSVEQVRQLASAHERGDMDEMSCAFMAIQAQWSPDWEQRSLIEMDLHKGDVSVVVFGANDATAGSTVTEGLTLRRPTGIRQRGHGVEARLIGQANVSDYDPVAAPHVVPMTGSHAHPHSDHGDGTGEQHDHQHQHQGDDDHDHGHLFDEDGKIVLDSQGVVEQVEPAGSDARARRERELELLRLAC